MSRSNLNKYVLVFGGTGAIGSACAVLLAKEGFGIISVYRERRAALKDKQKRLHVIDKSARDVKYLNINATDVSNENTIMRFIEESLSTKNAQIVLVLDAIADANINDMFGKTEMNEHLSVEDVSRTVSAMGTGLFRWVQLLMKKGFLSDDCRIIGLTSIGVERCISGYAATASAKAVLETMSKYMAVELKGNRMTSNVIRAGVIVTEAYSKLPNADFLASRAKDKHPKGRLTQPEDVANVVSLLMRPEADWINGAIIDVDGGERLIG